MEIRLCAFSDEAGASIDSQIDALKRNGIFLVELRSVDGKNIADIDLSTAEQIQKKLTEAGISVFSIGSPLGKSDIAADFAFEEGRLEHILRLARIFCCDRVRIFSFFTHEHHAVENEVFSRLSKMVERAAQDGVLLCHENEKDIYGDTVARVLRLIKAVEGLRFVYDPANFVQCGQDIGFAIEMVLPHADYLHIKDCVAKTGEIVPSGMGNGMIYEMIRGLKKDCVLTLEPHLSVFDGYEKIDNHKMKNKLCYKTSDEAFDSAADALKRILKECGFDKEGDKWTR